MWFQFLNVVRRYFSFADAYATISLCIVAIGIAGDKNSSKLLFSNE
jgi:hypothetical protein